MSLPPQKITPFLWFPTTDLTPNPAEEAARFYCSIFSESALLSLNPHIATFHLSGQKFIAMNGAPDEQKFTPAVSLLVTCEDQAEVDHFWSALGSEGGGEDMQCGWVRDKFGVSWQVVPRRLEQLMGGDGEKAGRVGRRMRGMRKLVIKDLELAANGE